MVVIKILFIQNFVHLLLCVCKIFSRVNILGVTLGYWLCSTLLDVAKLISNVIIPIYISTCMDVPVTLFFTFWLVAHDFNWISKIANAFKHVFIDILLTTWISFFVKCLFLACISVELFFYYLFISRNSHIYIFQILGLCWLYYHKYFL